MKWGVKYAQSHSVFASFVGPTDTKVFLAAIRKDEPWVQFAAVNLATGEVQDW